MLKRVKGQNVNLYAELYRERMQGKVTGHLRVQGGQVDHSVLYISHVFEAGGHLEWRMCFSSQFSAERLASSHFDS